MWILIDNYDSFTHILHHYLEALHKEVHVFKNDEIAIADLHTISPERIIISPGPKRPVDAGITMNAIAHFHNSIPILGVCLGHQALGEYFGAKLIKAKVPAHGKVSKLKHKNLGIFEHIPQDINITRYHSLVLSEWEDTQITPLAFTENQELMAFQHAVFPCVGLQFHPESILTEYGFQILKNWSESF